MLVLLIIFSNGLKILFVFFFRFSIKILDMLFYKGRCIKRYFFCFKCWVVRRANGFKWTKVFSSKGLYYSLRREGCGKKESCFEKGEKVF